MWAKTSGPLANYGHAGAMLEEWYIDWQLAGCRRLLDTTGGAVSVVKALQQLHRIAPTVSVDMLVDIWSQAPTVQGRDEIERGVRTQLAEITGQGPAAVKHLTKRSVKHDEEALQKAHADVIELANVRVAHMDARPSGVMVTSGDVDRLHGDVFEVVGRWIGLLKGTYLINDIDAPMDTPALSRALELFDWVEYTSSLSEAHFALGVAQPPGLRERLEAGVKVQYVWPELGTGS